MGLTNEKPKETIETVKLLADIAKGFELFKQYGLEKLVKDATAITESEQAKADDAKESISKMESLIAEQKQRQKQIDADELANEESAKQLSDEWKRLAKEAGELKKWEADVNKQVAELQKTKADLVEREKTINVAESKLADAKETLAATQKEADRLTAELKARADKMRGITEGL